jgi:hypothetical protein
MDTMCDSYDNRWKDTGSWAYGLHRHSAPQGSCSLPTCVARLIPLLALSHCTRAAAGLQLSEILVLYEADPWEAAGAELSQL